MKILDSQNYIVQKERIQQYLHKNPDKSVQDAAGILAVSTGCPILVVCHFIGELTSFTPELTSFMERLKRFYNVDGVR